MGRLHKKNPPDRGGGKEAGGKETTPPVSDPKNQEGTGPQNQMVQTLSQKGLNPEQKQESTQVPQGNPQINKESTQVPQGNLNKDKESTQVTQGNPNQSKESTQVPQGNLNVSKEITQVSQGNPIQKDSTQVPQGNPEQKKGPSQVAQEEPQEKDMEIVQVTQTDPSKQKDSQQQQEQKKKGDTSGKEQKPSKSQTSQKSVPMEKDEKGSPSSSDSEGQNQDDLPSDRMSYDESSEDEEDEGQQSQYPESSGSLDFTINKTLSGRNEIENIERAQYDLKEHSQWERNRQVNAQIHPLIVQVFGSLGNVQRLFRYNTHPINGKMTQTSLTNASYLKIQTQVQKLYPGLAFDVYENQLKQGFPCNAINVFQLHPEGLNQKSTIFNANFKQVPNLPSVHDMYKPDNIDMMFDFLIFIFGYMVYQLRQLYQGKSLGEEELVQYAQCSEILPELGKYYMGLVLSREQSQTELTPAQQQRLRNQNTIWPIVKKNAILFESYRKKQYYGKRPISPPEGEALYLEQISMYRKIIAMGQELLTQRNLQANCLSSRDLQGTVQPSQTQAQPLTMEVEESFQESRKQNFNGIGELPQAFQEISAYPSFTEAVRELMQELGKSFQGQREKISFLYQNMPRYSNYVDYDKFYTSFQVYYELALGLGIDISLFETNETQPNLDPQTFVRDNGQRLKFGLEKEIKPKEVRNISNPFNAQPYSARRCAGFTQEGYRLLQEQADMEEPLMRAYIFWQNCLYLSGTSVKLGEHDLNTEDGKVIARKASLMSELVVAQMYEIPLTITGKIESKVDEEADKKIKEQAKSSQAYYQQVEDLKRSWIERIMKSNPEDQVAMGVQMDAEVDALQERQKTETQLANTTIETSSTPVQQTYSLTQLLEKLTIYGEEDEVLELDPPSVLVDTEQEEYQQFFRVVKFLARKYDNVASSGESRMSMATLAERIRTDLLHYVILGEAQIDGQKLKENIRIDYFTLKFSRGGDYDVIWNDLSSKKTFYLIAYSGIHVTMMRARGLSKNPELTTYNFQRDVLEVVKEVIVAAIRALRCTKILAWGTLKRVEDQERENKKQRRLQGSSQTKGQPSQGSWTDWFYQDLTIVDRSIRRSFAQKPAGPPVIISTYTGRPRRVEVPYQFGSEGGISGHPCYDILYKYQLPLLQSRPPPEEDRSKFQFKDSVYKAKRRTSYQQLPQNIGGQTIKKFIEGVQKVLMANERSLEEPIFEFENVCAGGYVQVNPEADYMIAEPAMTFKSDQQQLQEQQARITRIKATIIQVSVTIDEDTRLTQFPVLNEAYVHWCACRNSMGVYQLPKQVEENINYASKQHVRVMTVRDMKSGASYPTSYVFCPDEVVASAVMTNLNEHFNVGALIPWKIETNPIHPSWNLFIQFPSVLEQLPPALYEYVLPKSGPASNISIFDLKYMAEAPYEYFLTSTTCLGYVGSMDKKQMLYGMTINEIIDKPRFLIRYMDVRIFQSIFYYDYRGKTLVPAAALPTTFNHYMMISAKIEAQASTEDKFLLEIHTTVYQVLVDVIRLSQWTLDGQLFLQQSMNTGNSNHPQELLAGVNEFFNATSSIRQWLEVFHFGSTVQQDLALKSLFPLSPEVSYYRSQLLRFYGSRGYYHVIHTLLPKFDKEVGTLRLPIIYGFPKPQSDYTLSFGFGPRPMYVGLEFFGITGYGKSSDRSSDKEYYQNQMQLALTDLARITIQHYMLQFIDYSHQMMFLFNCQTWRQVHPYTVFEIRYDLSDVRKCVQKEIYNIFRTVLVKQADIRARKDPGWGHFRKDRDGSEGEGPSDPKTEKYESSNTSSQGKQTAKKQGPGKSQQQTKKTEKTPNSETLEEYQARTKPTQPNQSRKVGDMGPPPNFKRKNVESLSNTSGGSSRTQKKKNKDFRQAEYEERVKKREQQQQQGTSQQSQGTTANIDLTKDIEM